MNGTGLALGGGGSRGAFQIGAWQAFRELDVRFDAIVGTSIGAINGALMVATDLERALDLWRNLTVEQCLAFSEDVALRSQDLLSAANADRIAREIVRQGGLDTQPLQDLLAGYIREEVVRNSRIRYGLMTATLPDLKPAPLWIDRIQPGRLLSYILASAHLPGLQPVRIEGQRYIDGGVAETVPVSMLRRAGFRDIVAVELGDRPTLRGPVDDNSRLVLIHDRQELGSFLDLTPAVVERNLRLGYLDAMKAFDRLAGEYYSFEPSEYDALLRRYGEENATGLEQAALAYGLDRCTVHTADSFAAGIAKRRREVQAIFDAQRDVLRVENRMRAIRDGRRMVMDLPPEMRLSMLIELTVSVQRSGHPLRIPMKLFPNLDAAVQAIAAVEGCEPRQLLPEDEAG
jgi:NTE family protein